MTVIEHSRPFGANRTPESTGSLRFRGPGRRAVTLPEVLIVAAICVFVVLLLMIRMPRGREQARSTTCLANLQQIGQALALYVQQTESYPANARFEPPRAEPGTSVLWAIRERGDLWHFTDVRGQAEAKGKGRSGQRPAVPGGLRCPSDRTLTPVSATNYRANAGTGSSGTDGPFGIGRTMTPERVEAGDGQAFTAAFAERLIGTGGEATSLADYVEAESCDEASPGTRRGDAGHVWSRGDWVSSLYQHGVRPNDGTSVVGTRRPCGRIGASSGHDTTVNVLLLDGSARPWRTSVDPTVWLRLGGFEDGPGR